MSDQATAAIHPNEPPLPCPSDIRPSALTPDAQTRIGDLRFRRLVGAKAWLILPPAVRHRFSKRLEGGRTVVYVGRTTEMYMTRAGFALAHVARLIGGPLPVSRHADLPSIVTVTEDMATGGQIWTRLYAHNSGFPQVIHSSKRFAGPTGLEEHVGCGIAMALRVETSDTALIFKSDHYFIQLGRFRLALPSWLSPGHLTVGHHEIDPENFAFTLDLVHPLLGHLIHQRAVFREATS